MPETLDQFWPIIEPALPPELIAPSQRKKLAAISRHLPIEGHMGFECRLDGSDEQVDLSQLLTEEKIPLLRVPVDAAPGRDEKLPWQEISRHWTDIDAGARKLVKQLWFEYELDKTARDSLLNPALFIEPQDKEILGNHKQSNRDAWFQALTAASSISLSHSRQTLLRQILHKWETSIHRDFSLGISGFMLSRDPITLRVLLGVPSIDHLSEFLLHAGLPRLPRGFKKAYECGVRLMKKPVVSLDLGLNGVSERMGLEFSWPGKGRVKIPREFMDWLEADELCSVQKRTALESFPITITPDQVGDIWPESFIVDSILGPEDGFSCITGQLFHIKLVFQPDRPVEAKAYFGFSHGFLMHESGAFSNR